MGNILHIAFLFPPPRPQQNFFESRDHDILLLCQLLSYYCLSTPKLPSILSDAGSVATFWLCQQLAVGIHQQGALERERLQGYREKGLPSLCRPPISVTQQCFIPDVRGPTCNSSCIQSTFSHSQNQPHCVPQRHQHQPACPLDPWPTSPYSKFRATSTAKKHPFLGGLSFSSTGPPPSSPEASGCQI